MRIYNGTNSQVDLPLAGSQRITIAPKSVSGDIMSSTELLSLLVTSYTTDELALVVSGPFEINQCAQIPTSASYVVQSLDEAIKRFAPKDEEKKEETVSEPVVEPEPEPIDEAEEVKEEVESKPEAEEEKEEEAPKKKKGGKKSK